MCNIVKEIEMTLQAEKMVAGKSCKEEGCSSHGKGPDGELGAHDVKRTWTHHQI
uniref:Uncharacterized protein n=1 Tax=uncultured archaeon MedDCM-OCT-S04-C140 TaxID=743085 RepID=D6PB73_9ARCH|nr:hypothetical protein [uncultured archaeon MedDCM-OCT-S04-C140]